MSARPRRAFTLVELVVVIVLLAVVAAMVAPRMLNMIRRQGESEAAAVQTLLSSAAQRDGLSSEPLAIDFDSAGPTLTLRVYRQGKWNTDPLIRPVTLSILHVQRAAADGQVLDPRRWRLVWPQTKPRPALWLLLAARQGKTADSWQVNLASSAQAASRSPASGPDAAVADQWRYVDLDETNQGNQPW